YVLAKAHECAAMAGRGLFDRFMYSIPPSRVGYREILPKPANPETRCLYRSRLDALANTLDALSDPAELTLSQEASDELHRWRALLETRRRTEGDLGHRKGWASKLDGLTVRLAGLLHLAEHAHRDGFEQPISAETMNSAIRI